MNRETRAWDTQDVDLLTTIFHPDMVWPWPPTPQSHDPTDWVLELGRYDRDHCRGRRCKIYTIVGGEWKLVAHMGLLDYPPRP